ncbi:ATP-binding protein [Actinoplanes sp. NPDC049118]|uniref:ATP-binding protein n=1 Tax=Actinoplanes sp. NPDC049118 TaxID=3155769 RepID=UPI0033DBD57F
MTDGGRSGEGDPAGPGSDLTAPTTLVRQQFSAVTVTALRHTVAAQVAVAGLSGDTADDFVLAVHELVTNAVRHGGGSGDLELRVVAESLVCDVIDHGGTSDGLPMQLSQADVAGGRGLWLAHHLSQALTLTRRPDGVTASVSVCLTDATAPSQKPIADPAGGSLGASPSGDGQR